MQVTTKRLLILLAACAFVLAIYVGIAPIFSNRLTITNQSTQELVAIDVSVWNQTVHVVNLQPGETTIRGFRSDNSDGEYQVIATFADGSSIQENAGYVTGGSLTGEHCDITVSDNAITITQRS